MYLSCIILDKLWSGDCDTLTLTDIMNIINRNVHFITREGQEIYMTMDEYPPELFKKMKLLSYFRRYMTDFLMKAGKFYLFI